MLLIVIVIVIALCTKGRFIIGVIPASLDCTGSKQWVGTNGSWGYIAGTGGKCHMQAKRCFDALTLLAVVVAVLKFALLLQLSVW